MLKTNENGRSMIEMLGVLAVIGVLSVGGIYGYKIAMVKHKANEVAQIVTITAMEMEAAAAIGAQGSMSLGDLPTLAQFSTDVKLGNITDHPNAGVVVDFGDDVAACKQFAQMYERSANFDVSIKCE